MRKDLRKRPRRRWREGPGGPLGTSKPAPSAPRFERLLLTKRFARALDDYLRKKPGRRAAVFRVLHGLTTDYRLLQRSPLHNPKHRVYHTRVSDADRLIDLPSAEAQDTLLLNLGDHSVNEWAQRYDGNPEQERRRAVGQWTGEAEDRPEEGRREFPALRVVTPEPPRAGTYGEYLEAEDLRRCGVPKELVPVVLASPTRTSLTELGLAESVDDAVVEAFCARAGGRPLPIPVPAVRPRSEDQVVLSVTVDQVPQLLRVPLHRYLAEMTEEQRRMVERPQTGLMVVKGAAGSGKTVVGVQRIVHLVRQATGPVRVLFLCYNQVLRDVVEQMLLDAGVGGVRRPRGATVWVFTAFQWMGWLRRRYRVLRGSPELTDPEEVLELVRAARRSVPGAPPTARVARLRDQDLLDEFREVLYGRAVEKEEDYLDAARVPRTGRKFPLLPEERRYVWRVFQRFQEVVRMAGRAPWEWLPYELLQRLPESHRDWPLYDVVVVDEAQDLLPAVFRVLLRVQGGSERNFLVLGDAAQNLYRSSFRWADTGLQVTGGHVTVLRRCFRSTRPIVRAAARLLTELQDRLGEDLVEPEETDADGPPPEVILAQSAEEEVGLVADRVVQCLQEGVPPSSVAVFAQRKVTLERVGEELRARGVPAEFYEKADGTKSLNLFEASVKLVTTYSAKGIEFPVVFVVGVTEGAFPSRGAPEDVERARRMLYTAMMRAGWRLTLTAVAEQASGLLSAIREP